MATTQIGSISGPDSYRTKWGHQEKYSAIASSILGNVGFDYMWEDWNLSVNAGGWTVTAIVGGTSTQYDESEPTANGILSLKTSVSANSGFQVNSVSGSVLPSPGNGYGFYHAQRIKLANVAATTYGGFGLYDNLGSTFTVIPGFFGALNASNFCVQYGGNFGGSALDLGLAIDTNNWHIIEMFCLNGGSLYARIDGRNFVSATPNWASYTRALSNAGKAFDTAGTTIRNIKCDWVLTAVATVR